MQALEKKRPLRDQIRDGMELISRRRLVLIDGSPFDPFDDWRYVADVTISRWMCFRLHLLLISSVAR